jgi:hypothetical protein
MMVLVTGCQTIKQKTDAIVEKDNEDFKNAKGNFEFVYNTKKYGIPCERRFEINSENIVVGFVSNGCF